MPSRFLLQDAAADIICPYEYFVERRCDFIITPPFGYFYLLIPQFPHRRQFCRSGLKNHFHTAGRV